jgi:hypothetical protein
VISIEGMRALAGIRRAWQLGSPRIFQTMGVVLLAFVIASFVNFALGIVPNVIGLAIGTARGGWVLVAMGSILSRIVTTPFMAIVTTLLYIDARIRQEGFDLAILATAAAVAVGVRANLPTPSRSSTEIRRAARRVLARPEYHRHDPNAFDRGSRAVTDFIGRLLTDAFAGPNLIGLTLFALLLAAIVIVSVRVGRGVTAGGAAPMTGLTIVRRTPADWRAEAAEREREGDWRGGLRCRYRALVAELADRGLVDEVPGRTAGEYRRDVAGSVPGAAADFSGATELFELAWYGNRPTGADDSARFGALADRVLAGASR